MDTLVWSPVYRVLEERIQSDDNIILIVVPFIKLDALKQLHWVQASSKVKVICRWLPADLASGASDVEIFPYLKEKGCQLYVNPRIHLKLYIFESNMAFNTSGNLTLRGLGYSDPSNIEVGNTIQLCSADWINIYHLISTSKQVDEALYKRFKQYVDQQPSTLWTKPPLDLFAVAKAFTVSAMPAVETPDALAHFYFASSHSNFSADQIRRASHDLVTFAIPKGLSHPEFHTQLSASFRNTPFVKEFVNYLRSNSSLRFGAVNEWLHNKCEDVPLPYKWEIKDNTRIFYNWLAQYLSPDITWSVPGQRSQVIYWQKAQLKTK